MRSINQNATGDIIDILACSQPPCEYLQKQKGDQFNVPTVRAHVNRSHFQKKKHICFHYHRSTVQAKKKKKSYILSLLAK